MLVPTVGGMVGLLFLGVFPLLRKVSFILRWVPLIIMRSVLLISMRCALLMRRRVTLILIRGLLASNERVGVPMKRCRAEGF